MHNDRTVSRIIATGAANDSCCSAKDASEGCCGSPVVSRRSFLTLSGAAVAATALDQFPVMAGPFESPDFARLIPPDKKLNPEWVQSLFTQGAPTTYTKARNELRFIGMPIGGICAGTLYLGGDGKLWVWDIFNQNPGGILPRSVPWNGFGQQRSVGPGDGASYVKPHEEESPLLQGFALKVNGVVRPLDNTGWQDVAFTGQYPIGRVTYSDPACPVFVKLTAYSPFIPLNADDSGLPATIMEFTLENTSDRAVETELAGWLQNACSLFTARHGAGVRVNSVRHQPNATLVFEQFSQETITAPVSVRKDILVENFEHAGYGAWTVDGTAFGAGPLERSAIPSYQGDVGGEGNRVVNSHASAPGASVGVKDSRTGKLTSPPFTLERNFITFFVGGGANVDQVGIRLMVDGKTVLQAAGRNDNHMRQDVWDVRPYAGKSAIIEIYDNGTSAWGNIGVDDIVQTDTPHVADPLDKEHDWGTMALALLETGTGKSHVTPETVFDDPPLAESRKAVEDPLIGAVTKTVRLEPKGSRTLTFVIAWNFPNNKLDVPEAASGNYYAGRFKDSAAVVEYVAKEYTRLSGDTRLWNATWYDSTLPHWFLDRTFANTSILATSTAHRFASGRFWAWEGVGCCQGTCTHVWHYAQAMGRVFPEIERYQREHVDFGVAFDQNNGIIGYRGEGTGPAVDGQCGRILGAYREHQMSADDTFLRRIWPQVRTAMAYLMRHDANNDGLLDGPQENTLDAAWFGEIPWISSLYAAALRACEEMARDVGDDASASLYHDKFAQSKAGIETQLFNGEYFIQKPEPGHEKSLGTYGTCHIDQVHGQSWAWQVNLGRILDRPKTLSALRALYKYNFAPDVGPFRTKNPSGRPYAIAGDAGLIMATNPQETPNAFGDVAAWQYGYFNECMSGFEHQAASHMIAEGLLLEGFTVTRAIHDRYHAAHRNPYNEIECSDHYSRAMASYGSFVTACGFEYHGPKGHIGFAPRLTPEDFRAPFTAAEGWGTFAQKQKGHTLDASLLLRHGRLHLKTLALAGTFTHVTAHLAGKRIPATVVVQEGRSVITFAGGVVVGKGEELKVVLG